jgi:hypothetical protein
VECREILHFARRLAVALAPLRELLLQETLRVVNLDELRLYGDIVGRVMRARFGEPTEEVYSEMLQAYRIAYGCDGEREAILEVVDSAEGTVFIVYTAGKREAKAGEETK